MTDMHVAVTGWKALPPSSSTMVTGAGRSLTRRMTGTCTTPTRTNRLRFPPLPFPTTLSLPTTTARLVFLDEVQSMGWMASCQATGLPTIFCGVGRCVSCVSTIFVTVQVETVQDCSASAIAGVANLAHYAEVDVLQSQPV